MNEEKIEKMLYSDDREMQEMGIILFHQLFPSSWIYEDPYFLGYDTRIVVTRARMTIYKKRRDVREKRNKQAMEDDK